jgi:glutamine synthetase
LKKVSGFLESANKKLNKLEENTKKAQGISDYVKKSECYRDEVFSMIKEIRSDIDALEMNMPSDLWPVPSYADLLFKL